PAQPGLFSLRPQPGPDVGPLPPPLRRAAAPARPGPGRLRPGRHGGSCAAHGPPRPPPHGTTEPGPGRLAPRAGPRPAPSGRGRLRREGPFAEVWVPSAAGNAGGALGAALFTWHQIMRRPRCPPQRRTADLAGSALD